MRNFTFWIMIIFAQGFGAMIGCVITAGGFSFEKHGDAKKITEGGYHVAQLCPSNGCNDGGKLMGQTFLVEFMMTFLFVTFVLLIV